MSRASVAAAERAEASPSPVELIPGTDIPAAPRFLDLLAAEAAEPGLRKGERTRRLIRLGTARALASTAFAALSMDLVAQAAGVSRAALYQYYRSKEDAVREVMTDFHDRTVAFPRNATGGRTPREAVHRTNRYYIDYFAKNAVFMERVRELRDAVPELLAERQRINAAWAARVAAHVARHGEGAGDAARDAAALRLRIVCLECMVDDALREAFVIGNPALAVDADALARELTEIWVRALYGAEAP